MKIAEEDFDPTRVLDGWQPPSDAASRDVDLGVIFGATRRATLEGDQIERLRRRGVAVDAIEDIGFADSPGAADDFVDTVSAADEVVDVEARVIDAPPSAPVRPGVLQSSVLKDWRPGCWIAAVRCLQPSGTLVCSTPAGPRAQDVHAQWLVAVWPPQRLDAPLLSRWPHALRVVTALDESGAAAALLPGVPAVPGTPRLT